jgi:hypothetical protein
MMIYLDLSTKKYVGVAGPDRFWSFLRRTGPTTVISFQQNFRAHLDEEEMNYMIFVILLHCIRSVPLIQLTNQCLN